MKTLLVFADQPAIVPTLRLALRQAPGFRVVKIADGRVPAGATLSELAPDVVLVDDMTRRSHTIARIHETAKLVPEALIVLLARALDPPSVEEAAEAGVHTIISRKLHPSTLGTLLRESFHGNIIHRPRPSRQPETPVPLALTSREFDILRLVAEGLTNRRIARELFVTEQTVRFHLGNVFRKLGVRNRTEASRYLFLHPVVDAEVPGVGTSA